MTLLRKRLLPILITAWTLTITVARAIRLPNDFAEAHWLLDYRFGFMKRGLIGSLCSLFVTALGIQMTPGIITALSAVTLLGLIATLLVLLARVLHLRALRGDAEVMGLAFASSPLLVMSGHLFGYFDALLYLFTIAAVALTLSDHPFLSALFSSIAMLTHESYLLVGFPLICLATVALLASQGRRARWGMHLVALCIPLLAAVAIPLFQALATDKITLRQQLTDHLNTFGFVSSRSKAVAHWQTTSFLRFFCGQAGDLVGRLLSTVLLARIGPTVLVILYFAHSTFRVHSSSLLSIATLGVVGVPLVLHIIAWDTERISTYTIGSAFIACWILAETRETQNTDDRFALLALPTLILNAFGRMPLMDGVTERFSDLERVLLYAPAIIFSLSFAAKAVAPHFVADLRSYWLTSRPAALDKE